MSKDNDATEIKAQLQELKGIIQGLAEKTRRPLTFAEIARNAAKATDLTAAIVSLGRTYSLALIEMNSRITNVESRNRSRLHKN